MEEFMPSPTYRIFERPGGGENPPAVRDQFARNRMHRPDQQTGHYDGGRHQEPCACFLRARQESHPLAAERAIQTLCDCWVPIHGIKNKLNASAPAIAPAGIGRIDSAHHSSRIFTGCGHCCQGERKTCAP